MIYFKMHADSKEGGIKCEHVIFTQACLHSTITSMRVLLPVKFGVGGGGGGYGDLKIVCTSGKILATPLYGTVFITREYLYTK